MATLMGMNRFLADEGMRGLSSAAGLQTQREDTKKQLEAAHDASVKGTTSSMAGVGGMLGYGMMGTGAAAAGGTAAGTAAGTATAGGAAAASAATAAGAGAGATGGAEAGSVAGPWGALIGAGVGALAGWLMSEFG